MASTQFINQAFGPYILREMIGGGGTAEVWRAEHHVDHRPMAVKILRAERMRERFHVRSFIKEQEVLSELSHPGIPRLRHQGEVLGRPAFALDFISGQTLAEASKHQALLREQSLLELSLIVSYLHEREIIHNDLKLENAIWNTSTTSVTLLDFGSVKKLGAIREITALIFREQPRFFNTATYVAPELLAGGKATRASDIYALGVCAFILLTGQPPFHDKGQSAMLRAHASAKPASISERLSSFSLPKAQIIDACLAKQAEERPTITDLIAAVRALGKSS